MQKWQMCNNTHTHLRKVKGKAYTGWVEESSAKTIVEVQNIICLKEGKIG